MSFFSQLRTILNSNQSRSVVLCGNVYDLFNVNGEYVPLLNFLKRRVDIPELMLVVYELNGPVRIEDEEMMKQAWVAWKGGGDATDAALYKSRRSTRTTEKRPHKYDQLAAEFDGLIRESQKNPTVALQFLRQLTMCSRAELVNKKNKKVDLVIIIEAADMLLPAGKDIASSSEADRRRVGIVQDWFCDPAFMGGGDAVVLISESRSLLHSRVSQLPQVLTVEVPSPDCEMRYDFIEHFTEGEPILKFHGKSWDKKELAVLSAGLSIHAIRQLLLGAKYTKTAISPDTLVAKVEQFIQSQVGEDVVEFKKPSHTLNDVVGFTKLKGFIERELIPRFKTTDKDWALPGAAVGGPIGGGKTFIFEAVAAELGVPVMVLKNLRSQWYGQTDVIFERLKRALEALEKVIIFVDEADTQFGGVGGEEHSTERRLTGKIQAMMSDPRLRGKVTWLLMTARIHMLSPDIRRPGRVGDLIIPILDPVGDDASEFCEWVVSALDDDSNDGEILDAVTEATEGYSAAAFASLRSNLKAASKKDGNLSKDDVVALIHDMIPPDIGLTREYQTLQALKNCTRRSLLPDKWEAYDLDSVEGLIAARQAWDVRVKQLEMEGIS